MGQDAAARDGADTPAHCPRFGLIIPVLMPHVAMGPRPRNGGSTTIIMLSKAEDTTDVDVAFKMEFTKARRRWLTTALS